MNIQEIIRRIYFRNEGNIWSSSSNFSSNNNLVRDAFLWSIFFSLMYPLIKLILNIFFYKYIQHFSKKKLHDLIGYLYSLIHHLVVVPLALIAIYSECLKTDEEWKLINFAIEYSFFAPYCFGYLMGDLIMYAIPAVISRGQVDMLLHHVLGLAMIYFACLTTPPVSISHNFE